MVLVVMERRGGEGKSQVRSDAIDFARWWRKVPRGASSHTCIRSHIHATNGSHARTHTREHNHLTSVVGQIYGQHTIYRRDEGMPAAKSESSDAPQSADKKEAVAA